MVGKQTEYPKRPRYFACQFIRLLTKKCVANELGAQAFTLLTVVAMTEDARGYTDPVTFFNEQLAPLVGAGSVDALDRVRKKCIESGWLHYTPGGRRIGPGRYFVAIPERYKNTDDAPTDEGDEAVLLRISTDQTTEQDRFAPQSCGAKPGTNREQTAEQTASKPRNLLPIPSPVPSPEKDTPQPPAGAGGGSGKSKGKKSSSEVIDAIPLPATLDVPEFLAVWQDWKRHRVEKRDPLTPTSVGRQLKKLDAMGLARAIACVEHTIEKGWTGLREPDGKSAPAILPMPQCRAPSKFEMEHGHYNPHTGFAKDAAGKIILDRLCRDLDCDYCKPRRAAG